MTTKIEANNGVITQINIFTVDPSDQQQLVNYLVQFHERVVRHQPGYVASIIHKSLDGRYIANYSQWSNLEAIQAAHSNPEFQAGSGFSSGLVIRGEPHQYEIVFEHQSIK